LLIHTVLKSYVDGRVISLEKLEGLVKQAQSIIASSSNPDRMSLWSVYVVLEYAILDLKLRHSLEGNSPPMPTKTVDFTTAKSMIDKLDPSSVDKKKLLYDLRSCRDIVKALVASNL
jgi:hypothetical protein